MANLGTMKNRNALTKRLQDFLSAPHKKIKFRDLADVMEYVGCRKMYACVEDAGTLFSDTDVLVTCKEFPLGNGILRLATWIDVDGNIVSEFVEFVINSGSGQEEQIWYADEENQENLGAQPAIPAVVREYINSKEKYLELFQNISLFNGLKNGLYKNWSAA